MTVLHRDAEALFFFAPPIASFTTQMIGSSPSAFFAHIPGAGPAGEASYRDGAKSLGRCVIRKKKEYLRY
jgi:hypothetical protein